MALNAYLNYRLADPSVRQNRTAGGTLLFTVDDESELPEIDVITGDTAITLDNSRFWVRENNLWVSDKSNLALKTPLGRAVRTAVNKVVNGLGIAGNPNTSQTVASISLPKNTLYTLGDRLNVRGVYGVASGLSSITATIRLNGVTLARRVRSGVRLHDWHIWVQYLSPTSANIVSTNDFIVDPVLTRLNVTGFDWTQPQLLEVTQSAATTNFLKVSFLSADIYPG
jgi:hypothetical protein